MADRVIENLDHQFAEQKEKRRHGSTVALALMVCLFALVSGDREERTILHEDARQFIDASEYSLRVDVNHACEAQLRLLPQIGMHLAGRIVEDRYAHGAFTTPEDLLRVHGIGSVTLQRIEPFIAIEP